MTFQRLAAYQIDRDNTQLQFVIAHAMKDVSYFLQMAENLQVSTFVAPAIHHLYESANVAGRGQSYVPELTNLLADFQNHAIMALK